MSNSFLYTGTANIYLQGDTALAMMEDAINTIIYRVGDPDSRIVLRDHREQAMQAARKAVQEQLYEAFADIFSQPAQISISANDESAEIELTDKNDQEAERTLWLGSIDNQRMAVHEQVYWELLKPIDETRVAFAALVS